jgi:hypothetical protein
VAVVALSDRSARQPAAGRYGGPPSWYLPPLALNHTDQADIAAVRAKLQSGQLPSSTPMKVWVGKGTKRPCMGCDRPVAPEEIEYEVDLPGRSDAEGVTLIFDQRCLAIWHRERAAFLQS